MKALILPILVAAFGLAACETTTEATNAPGNSSAKPWAGPSILPESTSDLAHGFAANSSAKDVDAATGIADDEAPAEAAEKAPEIAAAAPNASTEDDGKAAVCGLAVTMKSGAAVGDPCATTDTFMEAMGLTKKSKAKVQRYMSRLEKRGPVTTH